MPDSVEVYANELVVEVTEQTSSGVEVTASTEVDSVELQPSNEPLVIVADDGASVEVTEHDGPVLLLLGAEGSEAGPPGPPGPPGPVSFYMGHGPPDDESLTDAPIGASYLDADTGNLYQKE